MHPTLIDTLVRHHHATNAMAVLKQASFGEPDYYECAAVFENPGLRLHARTFLSSLGIVSKTAFTKNDAVLTWIMSLKVGMKGVVA